MEIPIQRTPISLKNMEENLILGTCSECDKINKRCNND